MKKPDALSPAPLQRRAAAKAIDVVLAVGLGLLAQQAHPLGSLVSVLFLLGADLIGGASPGKRAMALRVAVHGKGETAPAWSLLLRNLPLALAAPLVAVPYVGWVLVVVAASLLFALEGFLTLSQGHRRLGDRVAQTHLIETDPEADADGKTPMTRPDL
jgi:uncharacterized RDD family membrane protein YckC